MSYQYNTPLLVSPGVQKILRRYPDLSGQKKKKKLVRTSKRFESPHHKHVKVINSSFIKLKYNLASLFKQLERGREGAGGAVFMEIILPLYRRPKSGCSDTSCSHCLKTEDLAS